MIKLLTSGIGEYKLGDLFMDELRTKCEIITSSISDTEWMESILEKQEDILVRRYDYGSGRELLIVFERIKDC